MRVCLFRHSREKRAQGYPTGADPTQTGPSPRGTPTWPVTMPVHRRAGHPCATSARTTSVDHSRQRPGPTQTKRRRHGHPAAVREPARAGWSPAPSPRPSAVPSSPSRWPPPSSARSTTPRRSSPATGGWSPTSFHIELSPADHERLSPYSSALAQELIEMLREHADEQSYVFAGPVTIDFDEAEDLSTGRFRVRSRGTGPGDSRPPIVGDRHRGPPRPGGPRGQRHAGTRSDPPGIVVGRGTEADLRINDPGISPPARGVPGRERRATAARRSACWTSAPPTACSWTAAGSPRPPSPTAATVRIGNTDDDRAVPPATRAGLSATVSELTLMLIRFAYLAILWIFVLSAISVVRSDMFGARVDSAPRADRTGRQAGRQTGPQAGQARQAPAAAPPRWSRSPRAPNAGASRPLDDAPHPDRPRQRRRHPARRRLRLHPARPDRQQRRPVVRRGPRLHQRHLHRLAPPHPADHHPARQPGPDRQDRPRAAK